MSVPVSAGRLDVPVRGTARHPIQPLRTDSGYSIVEAAITLPVIFLLTMFIVQWAIVWHARNVAQATAQEALRTAESYQSTASAGQSDGDNYVAQVAPHVLGKDCVSVTRSPTTVTVRVHCEVISLVPFGHFSVDETVSGPVETYVP
jgi:Flp pilus assembly protein TadG